MVDYFSRHPDHAFLFAFVCILDARLQSQASTRARRITPSSAP